MLRIQPRRIAHDDALALKAPDPLGAGRGGQADALAQFGERQTPLGLQDAQDMTIDLVQFASGLMASSQGKYAPNKAALA